MASASSSRVAVCRLLQLGRCQVRQASSQAAGWNRKQVEWERTLESNSPSSHGHIAHHLGANIMMRCTTLDKEGQVTSTSSKVNKLDLCAQHGLQPRDLRKLDSRTPTVVPSILVRKRAILLNMLHLRVMITCDSVFIFDSIHSSDSFSKSLLLYNLSHSLQSTPANQGLPYEIRALESCLVSVSKALEEDFTSLRKMVVDLLDELERNIQREKLILLLKYSRKLVAMQKRTSLIQECLDDLLSNDEDLTAAYLTSKAQVANGAAHPTGEHEELELLLESTSKQVEEILSEVENLSANVKHTEEIINLILDRNRNELLGYDLQVSIGTLGITSGAMMAALFGMNLTSSLETAPFAFQSVTVAAVGLGAAVWILGSRRLRKLRKLDLYRVGRAEDERSRALALTSHHGSTNDALQHRSWRWWTRRNRH